MLFCQRLGELHIASNIPKKKAYRHVRKLVLDRTRQQGDVQRRECVHAINWKNYK
jgi:hypothetical protein